MPKVGNKEYPYTPEGVAAAETASDKSGDPVIRTYNAGGRVKRVKGYQEGGKLDESGIGYERPLMDKSGDITGYGDMNNDGKVDISDIVMAREKIAKFTPNTYTPDKEGTLRDDAGRTTEEFDALSWEDRKQWSETLNAKNKAEWEKHYKDIEKSKRGRMLERDVPKDVPNKLQYKEGGKVDEEEIKKSPSERAKAKRKGRKQSGEEKEARYGEEPTTTPKRKIWSKSKEIMDALYEHGWKRGKDIEWEKKADEQEERDFQEFSKEQHEYQKSKGHSKASGRTSYPFKTNEQRAMERKLKKLKEKKAHLEKGMEYKKGGKVTSAQKRALAKKMGKAAAKGALRGGAMPGISSLISTGMTAVAARALYKEMAKKAGVKVGASAKNEGFSTEEGTFSSEKAYKVYQAKKKLKKAGAKLGAKLGAKAK